MGDGTTMVQDLESMDLAQAQAIANQDDPHEQEIRNLILGEGSPGSLDGKHNVVDTKDFQLNLEVHVPEEEKGEINMAAQANNVVSINGKAYTLEEIAAINEATAAQAPKQKEFNQFQQAAAQNPPPTDQAGFTSWLWENKIYVGGAVAAIFLAWYLWQRNSSSSAEMEMVDAAAAIFTGV